MFHRLVCSGGVGGRKPLVKMYLVRCKVKFNLNIIVSHQYGKLLYTLEGRKDMFYLRLYGVGHMVKDHSDSESGNPLHPHGLLFPINSKGSFICTIPQTG